jgi:hypothetical protein
MFSGRHGELTERTLNLCVFSVSSAQINYFLLRMSKKKADLGD